LYAFQSEIIIFYFKTLAAPDCRVKKKQNSIQQRKINLLHITKMLQLFAEPNSRPKSYLYTLLEIRISLTQALALSNVMHL